MAEPISALPVSPEDPGSSERREPVPWPESPKASEPVTSSGANEVIEQIYEDVRTALAGSYRRTERAVSGAFNRSRRNVQFLVRERPLQVIAGVAIAAFLTGAALRVWRSRYE